MNYGIIFWGNSSQSIHISGLQKKVIRLITHSKSRDTSRELFKYKYFTISIMIYIFSLLIFVVNDKDQYKLNSDVHSINTRQNSSLYQPYNIPKRSLLFWHRDFNNLPSDKNLSHSVKQFRFALSDLSSFKVIL